MSVKPYPLHGDKPVDDIRHTEAGIAVILYVILIMLFVAAVMSAIVARMDDMSHQKLLQTQALYLQHARTQLRSWYLQNAAYLVTGGQGSAPPLTGAQILKSAGIQPQWHAQLFVSNESCVGYSKGQWKVCYRSLWLAVPAVAGAAPSFQNGVFTPGSAQYISVSGEAIETRLYNMARHQLKHYGTLLESGFAASETGGALHDVDMDWWAPNGCGGTDVDDGPFACSKGGESGFISWADYTQGSGIGGDNGKNPWGYAVLVNNSVGEANDTATPFTVELESPLPWGGAITSLIAQPL